MPRQPRVDYPGCWHHVFNRGLAKRTVFENRDDVRYFLSRLAHEARRGFLEIHIYAVVINHFHLLVRSPVGQLSEALRQIQNRYVRRFNRRRKRDGPLFRGRFGSKPVTTEAYWRTLVRYIDRNILKACLLGEFRRFPHGSINHYRRMAGPIWLERTVVEGVVRSDRLLPRYDPQFYPATFNSELTPSQVDLVEQRMRGRHPGEDPLDDLVGAAPEVVRRWMTRKAELADGTPPGMPLASAQTAMESIEAERSRDPDWFVAPFGIRRSAWKLMLIGILRDACGLSIAAISSRTGVSPTTVHGSIRTHGALVTEDAEYSERAAVILSRILDREHPGAGKTGMVPFENG